jgi:uncharacterized protein (DUF1800 family)
MSDKSLPPLDRVDPEQAWQPWEPSARDPWGLPWAGHLYRRAAFGGTPDELRGAVKQGHAAAVERILTGEPGGTAAWEKLLAELGEKAAQQSSSFGSNNTFQIRSWWLYAILNTPHPLQEKLTLFWHNHFATSIAKVQRPKLMVQQNVLLRRHALGKFRPFLLDVSRDTAMLYWLDSNSNVKGRPNENYARELMELFSLGVGNYTEADVRQAARAFTGWAANDDAFDFDDTLHDDGPKTVLGRQGNWNGDDIVRIVLEQPAAARFLVRKVYRFFINETADPPDALLEPLADTLRKSDYDIAVLMRALLGSRHFFSGYAYRQRVKDPVEYAVGAVRALWDVKPAEDQAGAVEPGALAGPLEAMGQGLFAPPNVKGWPGGTSWLNTATVLTRHNYAQRIAAGHLDGGSPPDANAAFQLAVEVAAEPTGSAGMAARQAGAVLAAAGAGALPAAATAWAVSPQPPAVTDPPPPDERHDIAARVRRENVADLGGIVDLLAEVLLQDRLEPAARGKLVAYLSDGKPAYQALDRRVRETAHAIMTMPEYQLA